MMTPLSYRKNLHLCTIPGEHNDYVFRKLLGMSQEKTNKLTEDKVLH